MSILKVAMFVVFTMNFTMAVASGNVTAACGWFAAFVQTFHMD